MSLQRNRLCLILVVLLITGFIGCSNYSNSRYVRHFENANLYFDKGDYDKAIDEYTKAIKYNPSVWEIYFNLAVCYSLSKDYDNVIGALNEAIKLNPDYYVSWLNRCNAYFRLSKFDLSLYDAEKAVDLIIKDTNAVAREKSIAYSNRGELYAIMGRYEEALIDGNKSIEYDSAYGWSFGTRGFAYYGMGEYEKALDDYNKAIERIASQNTNEAKADLYLLRGDLYIKLGNYDSAITDYNSALQIVPNNLKAIEGMNIALTRKSMEME